MATASAVALTIATDRVTAEVTQALADAGVESILLKGPSFARWLYGDPTERTYSDTDILVEDGLIPDAERVLRGLGFAPRHTEHPLRDLRPLHGHAWDMAGGRPTVDLHRTLFSAVQPPRVVWRVLRENVEHQHVGGVTVRVLNEPARALHVAVHAAQSGGHVRKPMRDLELALERPPEVWRRAALIAEAAGLTPALVGGLALCGRGSTLLDEMQINRRESVEMLLRSVGPPRGTHVLLALGSPDHTLLQRLLRTARFVFPSRSYMRTWAIAVLGDRRGGLGIAYLIRPLRLLTGAISALRWVHTARQGSRSRM